MPVAPPFLGVPQRSNAPVGRCAGRLCRWATAVAGLALALGAAAGEHSEMAQLLSMDLDQLSEIRTVTAAGRFPQKVTDAPSRVTIVTGAEMRAFGHRNLADVIRSIRGLHTGYDGTYEVAGTRGMAPSGDYNTRLLVLVDGIRVTDPVYSQGPVGNEFPIDLALIDRVEFLPGPGSAAYGNNAFFGLLNVVTRRPHWSDRGELSTSLGSDDEAILRATVDYGLGPDSRLLLSASRSYRGGPDYRFPAFAADAGGIARHMDSEAANRLFARLEAGHWNLQLVASDRTKVDPSAPFGTIFNDPRLRQDDRYVLASARREFRLPSVEAGLQMFYNRYEFRGDYPTDYPPPTVNHDFDLGERFGAEGQVRLQPVAGHTLSAWGEYILDPRIRLQNRDLEPAATYLDTRRSEHAWGFFIQDEVALGTRSLLNLGMRYDRLATGDASTNPRLALIVRPTDDYTAKLLYGTAFRAPNVYERFYELSDYSVANPALKPERVRTTELTIERQQDRSQLGLSLFHSKVTDLIELTPRDDGLVRFENRSSARVLGIELEGEWLLERDIRLRASLTSQRASDGDSGDWLPNSPRNLAKANMIVPLGAFARFGLEGRFESGRRTVAGTRTGGFGLLNLTLSGELRAHRLSWSASLYNALDRDYDLPATVDHVPDRLPLSGRTFRLTAQLRF